jgi:hypothetical protein
MQLEESFLFQEDNNIDIFFILKMENGIDLMKVECPTLLKYAKTILFDVIPNMASLVFVNNLDKQITKSSRKPVDIATLAKFKSMFLGKILIRNLNPI